MKIASSFALLALLQRLPRGPLRRVQRWLPTIFNYEGIPPGYFRTLPCRACRWPLTVIAVMAGLLLIVSTTEPGRYVYLKYGVARKNSDVILDRRKEDRRRIHQAAATPERRYGDRRHRDITRELEAFGWAVAHR